MLLFNMAQCCINIRSSIGELMTIFYGYSGVISIFIRLASQSRFKAFRKFSE